ncbi:Clp protease N-terminal domain-containing protein [Actinoplanes sp. N902-109]|uniref:Clp protease N-terminal domain-containing protein n=1 Tax=Actinoplanes sp. (strain N902-109) TaxID=649831 RepID=UPI000329541A|nr:Clp protease N-terminal domain-containing protein [Actinoplanes sp. N902-109]AGL19640.1 Clp domain-containing protein [Actinoplanes sp. N902-109]
MFERFTHPAREAVVQARFLATELRSDRVEPEHVLLALLAEHTGVVATAPALTTRGVDESTVRADILRGTGGTDGTGAGSAPTDEDTDEADREALKAIGIDLDAVRQAIERNFGPGAFQLPRDRPGDRSAKPGRLFPGRNNVPFSPGSKKVLALALREALLLEQDYIGAQHIMLGLLRANEGLTATILADHDVDTGRLRAELTRSLRDEAA